MRGKSCPICEGADFKPVTFQRSYQYIRCYACQTVYLDPMPAPDQVVAFYQNAAHFAGDQEVGYRGYAAMHKALAPRFRRRLRVLAEWLPRRGRLVDMGYADGYFLELAQADGWEVAGVEVSRPMAKEASRRLGIPVVTSVDALPSGPYDVITLWEIVEHLPDPIAELRRLAERIRLGAY